ncbi:MAG TPA: flavodoxin domain-containing protein [Smithellaceae bacterium]|nr:flavodoxin domain-containing protein [Smithellaceae bacterium]
MKALLLYHTKTGHTLKAANAVARGIQSVKGGVTLVVAKDFIPQTICEYDVFIVGSPCWGGSMSHGISTPIAKAIKKITTELSGKLCAGFAVNGAKGGENTVRALGERLKAKGCSEYLEGPVSKAGAPFSLWVGPAVTSEDLARCQVFGENLVKHFNAEIHRC